MSVVTTIITRHCTVHATDSFITRAKQDGSLDIIEDQATKIIPVPKWRGAICYWGLSRVEGTWDTVAWLSSKASTAESLGSAVAFAAHIAEGLNNEIYQLAVAKPIQRGLGMHFSTYECVGGYWIPELFLISNWMDESYKELSPGGFKATRETYATLKGLKERSDDHGKTEA